ncbi:MAG: hypothetical protein J1F69_03180 [Clostridiales bacterium]|nr:hypothetical protein [Clostridiales bacterium]
MIKQSVKNYSKCLKYVFTPLGIIALGLAFGLSIAIPLILGSISDMCKEIVEISGKSIDFEALMSNLVAAIEALDWSKPMEALKTVFTKKWFSDTVINNINPIVDDIEAYLAQVEKAIDVCINKVIGYAVIVGVFVVVAFIASYFLTKWMIRRDIAKRSIKQFVISTLIGSVLAAVFSAIGIWLVILWSNSIYITIIVAFLLSALYSLFSAYITHGHKKVPLKSIVNIKNVSKVVLSDLIIFAIGIAIILLVTVITNFVVGIFVAIGLLIVTVSVMEMTADAYVKDLVNNSQVPTQADAGSDNTQQNISESPAKDEV